MATHVPTERSVLLVSVLVQTPLPSTLYPIVETVELSAQQLRSALVESAPIAQQIKMEPLALASALRPISAIAELHCLQDVPLI